MQEQAFYIPYILCCCGTSFGSCCNEAHPGLLLKKVSSTPNLSESKAC